MESIRRVHDDACRSQSSFENFVDSDTRSARDSSALRVDFSRNFSPSAYRRTTTVRARRFPFSIYIFTVRYLAPRDRRRSLACKRRGIARAGAPRDRERVAGRRRDRKKQRRARKTDTECCCCCVAFFLHFFSQTTRSLVESDDSSVARRRRRSSRKSFAYSLVCRRFNLRRQLSLSLIYFSTASERRPRASPLSFKRFCAHPRFSPPFIYNSSRCGYLRCHFRRRQGARRRRLVDPSPIIYILGG